MHLPRRGDCGPARWAGRRAAAKMASMIQRKAVSTLLSLALSAAALLGAASAAQAQTAIVIGGALRYDNDEVWRRIVDEAGGPGARIAVFATAAANPERSAGLIIESLARNGGQAVHIPVAPRLAGSDLQKALHDPALIAQVRQSRAVFFSGGAQELIVDTLQPGGQPTELLKAIWAVYRDGGVVAGTSAGAAIMSRLMFRDAPDVMQVMHGRLRDGQEVDLGLGFVGPDLFIDQHFLKRGRIGRMLPLMQAKGYRLGLGVEENSAAVIHQNRVEVIGARGALLVDLSEARSDPALGRFNLQGARLSYLDSGDRHDLSSGQTTPSPQKLAATVAAASGGSGAPATDPLPPFAADMLADGAIVQAMSSLLDARSAELRGVAAPRLRPLAAPLPDDAASAPASATTVAPTAAVAIVADPPDRRAYEFRLYKGPTTRGWARQAAANGLDYTVLDMRLDVRPIELPATR